MDDLRNFNLVEIVGKYVEIKERKGEYWGLCPFHNEKTPSFSVNISKQLYHCLGCGAGGNAYTFVRDIEGISDKREVFNRLYEIAGIERPKTANDIAQEFFVSNATNALDYFRSRNLTDETIEKFGLGYAPNKGLLELLTNNIQEAKMSGLIQDSEDGKLYPFIRNRATFPIQDLSGKIVGFTGRTLGDEKPKYLNTFFRKNSHLYGMHLAIPSVRKKRRAIVCEGLFDVIALHQLGFPESVGVLGANFSEEQAKSLFINGAEKIYMALDSDEAGEKGVLRAISKQVAKNVMLYVVFLPTKDPGELLELPNGKSILEIAISKAKPEVDIYYDHVYGSRKDELSDSEKKEAFKVLVPRMIDCDIIDPVASRMRELVCEGFGIDKHRLLSYLRKLGKSRLPVLEQAKTDPTLALVIAQDEERYAEIAEHISYWEFEETHPLVHFKNYNGGSRVGYLELIGNPPSLIKLVNQAPKIKNIEKHISLAYISYLRQKAKTLTIDSMAKLKQIQDLQLQIEAIKRSYFETDD